MFTIILHGGAYGRERTCLEAEEPHSALLLAHGQVQVGGHIP